MTIGELREKLPFLFDGDREVIRPFCSMLCPVSVTELMTLQRQWDGSRPYKEFVIAQNKLLEKLIDVETSDFGTDVRKALGLRPLTLQTEIAAEKKVEFDMTSPVNEEEPHVRIVQLLCPERHCVVACPYRWPDQTKEAAIAICRKGMKDLKADPWCGICRSFDLRFEDAPTKFRTMQEAAPHLMLNQLEQAAACLHFNAMKNN